MQCMCTLNLKFVMKQKVKISLSLFFLSLKQNFEFKKNATSIQDPKIGHTNFPF